MSIPENTRPGRNIGAQVSATNANNDRLTYTLFASDEFEIDTSSGQLHTKGDLDHEAGATPSATVTATDPSNESDSITVIITIENVDETPLVTCPVSLEFPERTDTPHVLASYTSTYPDREGVELALTGANSDDFSIRGSSIYFNAVPDFEQPTNSNREQPVSSDNRRQRTGRRHKRQQAQCDGSGDECR